MEGCPTTYMRARVGWAAAARPAAPLAWGVPAAAAAGSTSAPGPSRLVAAAGWGALPGWGGSAAAQPPWALPPQPAALSLTWAECLDRPRLEALPALEVQVHLQLRPRACCARAAALAPTVLPPTHWHPLLPLSLRRWRHCRRLTCTARQSFTAAASATAAAAAWLPAGQAARRHRLHCCKRWAGGREPSPQRETHHPPTRPLRRRWRPCEGCPSRRSTRHHSWSPLDWPLPTCHTSSLWAHTNWPARLSLQRQQHQPSGG